MTQPLRVVVVGAGAMGRAWLAAVAGEPEVELAAIVDLDVDAAAAAAQTIGRPDLPVGTDVVQTAERVAAQAVIDVTVPAAHHPVTSAALFAGLPVLGEKPVAETVAEALSLAAASRVTGQLFMVSQSRRWNPQLFALRAMAESLGSVGFVTTEFFKAPRFGGFREEMAQPLLVDMAIHAFDSARYLLGADPVSAYCDAFNPPWSWYAGAASATAVFEMSNGARYSYAGSWCSPGAETSWNGTWRISGEQGTARWDGENAPTCDLLPGRDSRVADSAPGPAVDSAADSTATGEPPASGIAAALRAFVGALRTGVAPMGEVHENLMSLAMVEAAVLSAETGARVLLDDVLARAHETALKAETRAEVRTELGTGWRG